MITLPFAEGLDDEDEDDLDPENECDCGEYKNKYRSACDSCLYAS